MSYAIDRAIERGIDTARTKGKDGNSEYSEFHPMWRVFWSALVKAADWRDWGREQIRKAVMAEVKVK